MYQLSPDERNAIHEAFRNEVLSRLQQLPLIGVDDLAALDRTGCVLIIDSSWSRCTKKARETLLSHPEKLVREAATLRNADTDYDGEKAYLSGEKICQLMLANKLAIHELASRLSVSVKRVSYVREHGVSGRIRCYALLESIKGGKSFQK